MAMALEKPLISPKHLAVICRLSNTFGHDVQQAVAPDASVVWLSSNFVGLQVECLSLSAGEQQRSPAYATVTWKQRGITRMGDESLGRCRIADALNTENHALAAIHSKGYSVYLQLDARPDYLGDYWAIKGDRQFIASDPLRLLGLIAMWDVFGDDWMGTRVPDARGGILSIALPDRTYADLDDSEFNDLVAHLRPYFSAMGRPLPESPTREELAQIMETYYLDDPDSG